MDRGRLIAAGCGLALALAIYTVAGARGFRRSMALRREIDALAAQNERLARQNAALDAQVRALQKDPKAIERAAREQLGFVKPGEIVINLE